MRLLRRPEIHLHSQVNLYAVTFEPAPTPLCQFSGLLQFAHPQHIAIEMPRRPPPPRRHRELHMIDGSERMRWHSGNPPIRNSQSARPYRLPTIPRTDSISFAESYPTPSLNTVSTFSMSSIFFDGSPLTTTRSACLPAAMVPMRSNSPRNCAPFAVAIWIASTGVNPASTSNSTSR